MSEYIVDRECPFCYEQKMPAPPRRGALVKVRCPSLGIVTDYSNFPFGDFTVADVFALARESKEIGDDEFVKACMDAIRLNKCAAQ